MSTAYEIHANGDCYPPSCPVCADECEACGHRLHDGTECDEPVGRGSGEPCGCGRMDPDEPDPMDVTEAEIDAMNGPW